MYLISLKANKDTFHPVEFNETGLSIIVGSQISIEEKKTFNSVGKSLIIKLIHFCLGSNRVDEFGNKLPDWEFILEFKINGKTYVSKRSTNEQDVISLNAEEKTIKEFNQELEKLVFGELSQKNFVSFRGLISRFIRPRKISYSYYDRFVEKESEIAQSINNAYLLGLDVDLILKKYSLKEELDKIEKYKSAIEKDSILKSYFEGDKKNINIEIVNLEEKVKKLEGTLKEFKIAEDYDKIRIELDEVVSELKRNKNKASALKNNLRLIEESIIVKPDITKAKLVSFYNQANIVLKDWINKKLEELEEFNNKLLKDRAKRLSLEKETYQKNLTKIESEIARLGQLENEKMGYLNTHGALEEYSALMDQLNSYKNKFNKLSTYKELLREYATKIENIKREFTEQNIRTLDYLVSIEQLIKQHITTFNSLTQEFYVDKPAGIDITNNDGNNHKRFNIRVKIADDAGDGVNEIKIFCYDWTVLKSQRNHSIKFLFHDSRLLAETDPRQIATLFKLSYGQCIDNGFQYIISVNENTLESIKKYYEPDDYTKIIEENIILSLTDESPESKLLGVQIDFDYEE